MLMVLSPAKTLDFDTAPVTDRYSQPDFLNDSETLIEELRRLSPPQVSELMGISNQLADLNFGRFLDWHRPFKPDNAKQAVLAFKGDVYTGLDADSLKPDDLAWAQDHLRILSGLYGLLRPLDLMQPYRLEMGTKFANSRGKDLYQFWGDSLTRALSKTLEKERSQVLVNLASNEYFKAVKKKALAAEVITPVFKDWKNGKYKVISFYAKKARGAMARFAIENRLDDPEGLKAFDRDGYRYNSSMSSPREWVFVRDPEAA